MRVTFNFAHMLVQCVMFVCSNHLTRGNTHHGFDIPSIIFQFFTIKKGLVPFCPLLLLNPWFNYNTMRLKWSFYYSLHVVVAICLDACLVSSVKNAYKFARSFLLLLLFMSNIISARTKLQGVFK